MKLNVPKAPEELKACWLLWNYTLLGACIKNKKQSDKWLKVLKEIENEINRHIREGCICKK